MPDGRVLQPAAARRMQKNVAATKQRCSTNELKNVSAKIQRLVVAVFGKNMVLRLLALIRLSEKNCGRYARTAWIKTP